LPDIRLHDLRPAHANVSITRDVYSHAVPTLQREAASQIADLIFGPW
jgi:hypothetical protein